MVDSTCWGQGNGHARPSGTHQEYSFSLRLRVDSSQQLWQAAASRCRSQSDLSQDDIEEMIGPIEDPSIADCLMIMALPERLPGCTRLDTALQPGAAPHTVIPALFSIGSNRAA